jgi:ribokinase
VTKIGQDLFAPFVRDAFDRFGLAREHMFETSDAATGVALIAVERGTGRNSIAVATGACDALTRDEVERSSKAFEGAKIFLTQLESNLDATLAGIGKAHALGATVILNPAPYSPIPESFLENVDILVPNEVECAVMSGIEVTDDATAREASSRLSERVDTVIITLGDRGLFCSRLGDSIIPAMKVATVDTTGAGDAFCGTLAAYLARDTDFGDAVRLAMAGAALSTTRFGTSPSMPTQAEIESAATTWKRGGSQPTLTARERRA